jgi:hypothetical protein
VIGINKATLAHPDEATATIGGAIGAISPFVDGPGMGLVIDRGLVERFGEIAFNAGRLDRSIVLDPADYVRIVRSLLHVASIWSAAPDRAFGDGPCKHGIGPDRRPRRLEKYVLSRCPIPQQSA